MDATTTKEKEVTEESQKIVVKIRISNWTGFFKNFESTGSNWFMTDL